MLLWFFIDLEVVTVGVLAEFTCVVDVAACFFVEVVGEFSTDAFCNAFATFEYRKYTNKQFYTMDKFTSDTTTKNQFF